MVGSFGKCRGKPVGRYWTFKREIEFEEKLTEEVKGRIRLPNERV